MIISKYSYLTEEERVEEFGRIMGKGLRKLAKEKGNKASRERELKLETGVGR